MKVPTKWGGRTLSRKERTQFDALASTVEAQGWTWSEVQQRFYNPNAREKVNGVPEPYNVSARWFLEFSKPEDGEGDEKDPDWIPSLGLIKEVETELVNEFDSSPRSLTALNGELKRWRRTPEQNAAMVALFKKKKK